MAATWSEVLPPRRRRCRRSFLRALAVSVGFYVGHTIPAWHGHTVFGFHVA